MKLIRKIGSVVSGAVLGLSVVTSASAAEDTIKFGLCYDLSKVYTFVTPQIAQGAQDLADLVNKQGGIGGHQVEMVVRDHGNEVQRGIECYEKMKREGIFVFDTMSTPVSIALIPRLIKDGNILLQPLVGRGDAVDGSVFTQVFPIGPTYWGQAANIVDYIRQQKGGSLKGAKIAFFYIDYAYGQEPIGVLKTLAEREGFELGLFPIPLPGNDQSSAWSQIRRFNPDFIMSWNFGGIHVAASREMKRNGIPMEKYISNGWLNEHDIESIGAENAIGLKRATAVAGGTDIPIIQQIITELYEKGEGNGESVPNDVYYNFGIEFYSTAFEGARLAIEKHGWPLTAETMRDGMESITDFTANGLLAPLTVTPADHGGGGATRIDMWDGEKWVPQTDYYTAYNDVVWEVIKESSAKFAAEQE